LCSGGAEFSICGVNPGHIAVTCLTALALIADTPRGFAAAPVVSNVRAAQRAGTKVVDIYYDVADADSSALTVSVAVSTNGGAAYFSPGASASGAVGTGLAPGNNRKMAWNAEVDLPPKLFSNVRVSVTASDDTGPSGLALIPAGSFTHFWISFAALPPKHGRLRLTP